MPRPTSADDTRQYPRVAVTLPVLRRAEDGYVEEQVVDISRDGIALVSATPLAAGTAVELLLGSADKRIEVPVQAEVIWVRSARDSNSHTVGLRFVNIDAGLVSQIELLLVNLLTEPQGRRAGPRVDVNTEAFWKTAGERTSDQVMLLNASLGGALMHGTRLPQPGTRGLVSLIDPSNGEVITVPAQTRWLRGSDDNCDAGIKFEPGKEGTEFLARLLAGVLLHPRSIGSVEAPLNEGARLGGFELISLIGRGRSSEVWAARAVDPALAGLSFAVKRFLRAPSDPATWGDWLLEAAELGRVMVHPGVLRVHSAHGSIQECWLAMEHVAGSSLDQVLIDALKRRSRPRVESVVSVVAEVLNTLEYCHRLKVGARNGIFHGDLRPSCVLIGQDGRVLVSDFGHPNPLARGGGGQVAPDRLPYVAPEMLVNGGVATAQSDVFQVGIILYEALTSVVPFRGNVPEQLANAVSRGPVAPSRLNPSIGPALEKVIVAALAADPYDRPIGARGLASALHSAIDIPTGPEAAAARAALTGADGGAPPEEAAYIQPSKPSVPTISGPPMAGASAGTLARERSVPEGSLPASSAQGPPERSRSDSGGGMAWPEAEPEAAEPKPGDMIARYSVLTKLASGGMGDVWLARSVGPGGFEKTLALKTIRAPLMARTDLTRMFLNEARVAARINHPNIVQIFDVGFDRGIAYLAMEYQEGRTVADVRTVLADKGEDFPEGLAAWIIAECCAGLDYAHNLTDASGAPLNIVHRDVTARNIYITYSGKVMLLDFGLAKAAITSGETQPGTVRGTCAYVSPELLHGEPISPAADVWALGINLYSMLTGRPPFSGATDADVLLEIANKTLVPASEYRPGIDSKIRRVIDTALQKSTSERYPSAKAMLEELKEYLKTKAGSSFDLAQLMERLFPKKSDFERYRLAQIASGTPLGEAAPTEMVAAHVPRAGPVTQVSELAMNVGKEPATEVRRSPSHGAKAPGARPASKPVGAREAVAAGAALAIIAVAALFVVRAAGDLPAPRFEANVASVMVAAPPPVPGELVISASVAAAVAIDGSNAGFAPARLRLPPGDHRVRVTTTGPEGHAVKEWTLTVKPGQTSEEVANFDVGTLAVAAVPWAEVKVDGNPVGRTPIAPVALLEGRHEVSLENPKLGTKRRRVVLIVADQVAELKVDMKR